MNPSASLPPTRTLAALYIKQGLLQEAEDVYERLLEAHPQDEEIKEALQELRLKRSKRGRQGFSYQTVLFELERLGQAIRSRRKIQGFGSGSSPRIAVLLGPASEVCEQRGEGGANMQVSVEELEQKIKKEAKRLALVSEVIQAVDETTFAHALKAAYERCDALIVSPGALDLKAIDVFWDEKKDCPVFEVHPENFHQDLMSQSPISSISRGYVAGFGAEGFTMAIRAIAEQVGEARKSGA